jgi:L-phenylalanine/L-methionine N-acetyltransferase
VTQAVRVRHAEPGDAAGLHALFAEPEAYAATLQLPYPSLALWEARLRDLPAHVVQLVAEADSGGIAGAAGFEVLQSPRRRHVANLGMAVAPDHRGRGVGTQLLGAVIDTAERWHGVRRLELEVFTDNTAAIALYERHGFVREGLARGYALRDGAYADVLLMARYPTLP